MLETVKVLEEFSIFTKLTLVIQIKLHNLLTVLCLLFPIADLYLFQDGLVASNILCILL